MTFEWSPRQEAFRQRARAFARGSVQPHAATIDRHSSVPADLAASAAAIACGAEDLIELVVSIEELAMASGAVAMVAAAGGTQAGALGLSGLRGATAVAESSRTQLVLAAVAIGLGHAAVEQAVADLRLASSRPGHESEKPHWELADAATELEAARLMTYEAAAARSEWSADAAIAMARLLASAAASHAVDAALRIAGAPGVEQGALLERLSRDVRTVGLLLGGEDRQRAKAADGLWPHETV